MKKIVITLSILIFTLISFNIGRTLNEEEKHEFKRAEKYVKLGKFTKARNELLRLIQKNTHEVKLYSLLAHSYHGLGNFEFATNCLKYAIKIAPDSITKRKLSFYKKEIELEEKKYKLDSSSFKLKDNNYNILSMVKYGNLLETEERYFDALNEYQKIKKIYPNQEAGYYLTGRLKFLIGHRQEGLKNIKKIFSFSPYSTKSVELLINYGFSPERIKIYGFKGKIDYNSLEKYGANLEYSRGYKLFLKNKKEAEIYLKHAIKLNPDHMPAQLCLGEFYYKTGNLDGAFDRVQEVLRLDKNSERAYELKYYILKRWGYDKKATETLLTGLNEDTYAVQLRLLYGVELSKSHNRRNRRKSYKELKMVIKLDPKNKEAADALQTLGLRHNRIRELGYKGILLPLSHFDIADTIFIPREKKKKKKKSKRNIKKSKDLKNKGRFARRRRKRREEIIARKKAREARRKAREKRRAERLAKRSEEVALKQKTLVLNSSEVKLEEKLPPIKLDQLIKLINQLKVGDTEKDIYISTAKRLFPKLNKKEQRAYIKRMMNRVKKESKDLEISSTNEVVLKKKSEKKLKDMVKTDKKKIIKKGTSEISLKKKELTKNTILPEDIKKTDEINIDKKILNKELKETSEVKVKTKILKSSEVVLEKNINTVEKTSGEIILK